MFPLLGVVAMGLSHAVFLIQMFHEWLLRKVTRLVCAAVPREWGLRPGEARRDLLSCVIVDDLNLISLDGPELVNEALAEAEPVYESVGRTAKESKREPAALRGRKVAGVNVEGEDKVLVPPPEKLSDVARTALDLLQAGEISIAAVDRVVHIMGWYFSTHSLGINALIVFSAIGD